MNAQVAFMNELSVHSPDQRLGVLKRCPRTFPRQPFFIELAPYDKRATDPETFSPCAPLRRDGLRFGLRDELQPTALNFVNVKVAVDRIVRPALPRPHIHAFPLRNRGIRQAHSETANPRAVFEVCAIAKLKSEPQHSRRHALSVIEDGDRRRSPALPLADEHPILKTEDLDRIRLRLNRVVDQLGQRVCSIAISAVPHRADRKVGGNDVILRLKVVFARCHHPKHPPNS